MRSLLIHYAKRLRRLSYRPFLLRLTCRKGRRPARAIGAILAELE